MSRVWLAAAAVALAVSAWPAPAAAFTREELTLTMDDGVTIAATLHLPGGAAPPGGWPAVILMHGLAGDRSSMNALAAQMGLVGEQYAVLTFDARGHGASGGLIGIDGPREIADVRAVFSWLAERPDVADARIGAFGISYGGGAALNSLAAGVPWAALELAQTWTDLTSALLPQGLAKSGVIGGFLSALPPARLDPSVLHVRDAAFAGSNLDFLREWGARRSSLSALRGVRTPVFFMQGRRDFAFGIDQATRAYALLAGPKRLWIGLHGHAPSTFPAADTPAMLRAGKRWYDRFLRAEQNGIEREPRPVSVTGSRADDVRTFAAVPKPTVRSFVLPGRRTIAQSGRIQRSTKPLAAGLEAFGAPVVNVRATAAGGWSRIVAVLSARTPAGETIVVSGGGVPAAAGTRAYAIRLIHQATRIPKGSRLTVTLGASSLRQDPGNLLYLDLPMANGARLSVGRATLILPTLPAPARP
jgi:predicted acyl esterase